MDEQNTETAKVHIVQTMDGPNTEIDSVHWKPQKAVHRVKEIAKNFGWTTKVVTDMEEQRFMGYCDEEHAHGVIYQTFEVK